MVGQKTLDNDLLLYANPEKYPPVVSDPLPEVKPLKSPYQGEFILIRKVKLRPLKLK